MAEDMGSADRPVRISYKGEAGELQAAVATPLAVVITELLQNAAEHAFPHTLEEAGERDGSGVDEAAESGGSGERATILVNVELSRSEDELRVTVRDNGVGLPAGFTVGGTTTLGLMIVRGLVITQLGGTLSMRNEGGTVVELTIPLDRADDDLESL